MKTMHTRRPRRIGSTVRALAVVLLTLGVALASARASEAPDWPDDLAHEGECTVCTRRGASHGTEDFVDWRRHHDRAYGFCSTACAEAFDQMPDGYADPVLPREAPAFAWTTLDGQSIEPSGQVALVVDFWATWCKPCIEVMPELEELGLEYAGRGVRIVGVSIDEERDVLDRFLRRRPVEYDVVHDGGEDPAWWQFQVPAIPAAFLLDGQGRIVAQWNGELDVDELRSHVDALVESAETP